MAEPELWVERLHPDDRDRVLDEERLRAQRPDESGGLRPRVPADHADGCVVWVWERDTVVRDDAGRPESSQGMLIDVTARKLAEARAQHYLDVAGTILLVLRTDETVDLLNRHGRELIGYGDERPDRPQLVRHRRPRGGPRRAAGQLPAHPARRGAVHLPPGRHRHPRRRAAHDRLAQHPAARRARPGDRRPLLRRGHHRAAAARRTRSPASPTSTRSPGCPTGRSSRANSRRCVTRAGPLRPRGRAAADRPRQLQARQRLVRPRRRRPAAAADRRAPARRRGRRTCSRASAATSS